MKFVIILLSSFILVKFSDGYNQTLNYHFEIYKYRFFDQNNSEEPIMKKIKTIDINCVKDRLKLSEFGDKDVDQYTFLTAFFPALTLCSGNSEEFVGMFLLYMTNSVRKSTDAADCFKLKIQEIEPTAIILEGFDSNSVRFSKEDCDDIVNQKDIKEYIDDYNHEIGNIEILTCGVIKENEILKLVFTYAILALGNLESNIEAAVKKNQIENLLTKVESLEKCAMDSIENGPFLWKEYEKALYELSNDDSEFGKIFGATDQNCVKEKLNFEQNSQKSVEELEFQVLILSAMEVCKPDQESFWNFMVNHTLKNLNYHFVLNEFYDYEVIKPADEISERDLYCVQENLYKIKPNATILKNFVLQNDKNCEEETKIFTNFVQDLKDNFENIEGIFCGFVTLEYLTALDLTVKVYKYEKNDELKQAEIESLKVEIQEKIDQILTCNVKKLNQK